MTVRCTICYETFEGVVTETGERDIAPGDQLADHLTDQHQSVMSKRLSEGVLMDA